MGVILGAPFKWEWNRTYSGSAITTVAGVTDYKVSLSNFGYLEKSVLINPNFQGQQPPAMELELYKVISLDTARAAPRKIATLLDDNAGNITFRLMPTPDAVYNVDLIYQNAPNFIAQGTNLGITTWKPIPDKMSYLYQRGFLSQLQGMYNPQLYLAGMSMFYRQLVSAAEGLTEMEKAIFLEEALRKVQTQAEASLTVQQGKAARG